MRLSSSKDLRTSLNSHTFTASAAKRSESRLRTEPDEGWSCLKGNKLLVCSKRKSIKQLHQHPQHVRKMSNFQILKKKMNDLDNQQFLGNKSPRESLADLVNKQIEVNLAYKDKVVTQRMLGCTKHNFKFKYRRKQSENASKSLSHLLPSFPQISVEGSQKRTILQQSSQCAKKYFKPVSRERKRSGMRGKQNGSSRYPIYFLTKSTFNLI